MIWFRTPRIPFCEPFADGELVGALCPRIMCENLGLSDVNAYVHPFVVRVYCITKCQ